jgi:lysophospholipase L1-like esterase
LVNGEFSNLHQTNIRILGDYFYFCGLSIFMLQQILFYIGAIILTPFLPILYFLGKKVRKSVPELPEASENVTGSILGTGYDLQILGIGESSIAGVGVTDFKDSITGQCAKKINELTQKTVHWQVLARNGYTAERANLKLVPRIPDRNFDFILIGMGGNDTFKFSRPLTFRKHIVSILTNIQKRQPNAQIILINMPPIADFPAFPWYFKLIMGNLVALHRAVLLDVPKQFNNVSFIDEKLTFDNYILKTGSTLTVNDFFCDGIHPSAMTYSIWGGDIGTFIVKEIV